MNLDYLIPYPQKVTIKEAVVARPTAMLISAKGVNKSAVTHLKKDLREIAGIRHSQSGFPVKLTIQKHGLNPEGYKLRITKNGISIVASDEAGLFYGSQTLLQMLSLGSQISLPIITIDDWPQYRTRSFMVDLGRASFSLTYLKRIVRILARIKMNTLHLHLCDDPLSGLRYSRLPIGTENPQAITIAELKKLISYAHKYHINIIPEVECWGHCEAVLSHFPELRGGVGMWGGASYAVGEPLFDLLAKMFDELIPALDKECMLHIGMDEANWFLDPSIPEERRKDYTPTTMVQRIYDILQAAGQKHDRHIEIHLWADHGGRPLPRKIAKELVVQPWMYFENREADIVSKVKKYSGKNKAPFMMGGGMSSHHFSGHFGATRVWCQAALNSPNVEGITICQWLNNNIEKQLIGLYGGSAYAWNPLFPDANPKEDDFYREHIYAHMHLKMQRWQRAFPDATSEAINRDRGAEVTEGIYGGGEQSGLPVAPTASTMTPFGEHKAMDQ